MIYQHLQIIKYSKFDYDIGRIKKERRREVEKRKRIRINELAWLKEERWNDAKTIGGIKD